MRLNFPNARLYIHNLLADGQVSGAKAIVLSACEFGLLDSQAMQSMLEPDSAPYNCMAAAKQVLFHYLKGRTKHGNTSVDPEQIWSVIEDAALEYEVRANNAQSECRILSCRHNCPKLAPVLFDLMLQQIRYYP